MTTSHRVLLLSGYFDWMSGYQETVLAAWLPRYVTTEVVAGDRVSPIFADEHLARLGMARRYATGTRTEQGVKVTRFPTIEKRSMVWSTKVAKYIESQAYDLIVQVMPGQLMPATASFCRNQAVRAALYGDNSAMWSHLPRAQRLLKGAAFALSKGVLYAVVNRRADLVYGYTPNTVSRLRRLSGGRAISLLPLAFDPGKFYFDEETRRSRRQALGYTDSHTLIVAAGKFQQKKGLDLLLEAFVRVAPNHPHTKLLLVGADDSSYSRGLAARIAKSATLRRRVDVMSFVNAAELNAIFNCADIGVWPRMPAITIQQALATGLRVILPVNDWVGHLLRPGAGTYFDNSTHGELSSMTVAIERELASDWSAEDRQGRADANSWLGADTLTRSLLRDAGICG